MSALPGICSAHPAPQLSARITESQVTIAKAVHRLRAVSASVAEIEPLVEIGKRNRGRFLVESWRRRDEQREARRALHITILSGLCAEPESSADCDAQLKMLDCLDEIEPGFSKHESADGFRQRIENNRLKLASV